MPLFACLLTAGSWLLALLMVCADPLYRSAVLQVRQRALASEISIAWLYYLSIGNYARGYNQGKTRGGADGRFVPSATLFRLRTRVRKRSCKSGLSTTGRRAKVQRGWLSGALA